MKKLMLVLAAFAAANAYAIKGSISTEVETVTGDIKWQPRSKAYLIDKGKNISVEIKVGDVEAINIPKPATFDEAVKKVEAGQGAAAIPALTKIVEDYRMLQWDKPAGRYLALAYLSANNAPKALEICNKIVQEDRSAGYSGDLASAYWQALMRMGKTDQLEGLLKKAATAGDRAASAAALVMRGDLIVDASGDNPEQLRKALRDGYLRVVLMYRDPECRRERVDACVKAASVFDKLGQSGRAERLRAESKQL